MQVPGVTDNTILGNQGRRHHHGFSLRCGTPPMVYPGTSATSGRVLLARTVSVMLQSADSEAAEKAAARSPEFTSGGSGLNVGGHGLNVRHYYQYIGLNARHYYQYIGCHTLSPPVVSAFCTLTLRRARLRPSTKSSEISTRY
jgi:hypothetical protein